MNSVVKHLSASSISEYLTCPRKWAFRYVDGMQTAPNHKMALGSVGHKAAEWVLLAKLAGKELPSKAELSEFTRDVAKVNAARVDWTGDEDERAAFADRADAYALAFLEHVAPGIDPIAVEHRFEVDVYGTKVVGFIDVLERTAIHDLKTTSKKPLAWGDPRHRFQLGVYALAMESRTFTTPSAVSDVLVMSETKKRGIEVKHLPIVYAPEDVAAERDVARLTISTVDESIERGDMPRNPIACEVYGRLCEHARQCMPQRASAAEKAAAQKTLEEAEAA